MKTIAKTPLFIGLCCLLMAASCKKEKTVQSELVTLNGQTFGCRVDGTPFIADLWDYGNNIPPIHVDIWYSPVRQYHYLIVTGKKSNQYVEVYLNPPLTVGRRELKFNTRPYPIETVQKDYGLYQVISPSKEYITNSMLGGFVDIFSVDTITLRIEGRFEFTGTDQATGKTITITNGYFKNFNTL